MITTGLLQKSVDGALLAGVVQAAGASVVCGSFGDAGGGDPVFQWYVLVVLYALAVCGSGAATTRALLVFAGTSSFLCAYFFGADPSPGFPVFLSHWLLMGFCCLARAGFSGP